MELHNCKEDETSVAESAVAEELGPALSWVSSTIVGTPPSSREDAGCAYDETGARLICFGGPRATHSPPFPPPVTPPLSPICISGTLLSSGRLAAAMAERRARPRRGRGGGTRIRRAQLLAHERTSHGGHPTHAHRSQPQTVVTDHREIHGWESAGGERRDPPPSHIFEETPPLSHPVST